MNKIDWLGVFFACLGVSVVTPIALSSLYLCVLIVIEIWKCL